jgi:hypothetical protein
MGLLKKLLIVPWVAERVVEEAERQEYSPEAGIRKLEELEALRERGEISEEQAAELEGKIIEQQAGAAHSRPRRSSPRS